MRWMSMVLVAACGVEAQQVVSERVVFGSREYGCSQDGGAQFMPLPEGIPDDAVMTATHCYADGTCIVGQFTIAGDEIRVYCSGFDGIMTLRWVSLP